METLQELFIIYYVFTFIIAIINLLTLKGDREIKGREKIKWIIIFIMLVIAFIGQFIFCFYRPSIEQPLPYVRKG